MTITVTPTVENSTGDTDPARIRLDVTASAGETTTTVTRLDPDGVTRIARTADGDALALSGGVGLLYDYEAPYGHPVTYSTLESPATVSAGVTIDEPRIWLVHPGVPALSTPIDLRPNSLAEEGWDVAQGVYWPIGNRFPVVNTDGARKAPSATLVVAVESAGQLAALRDVTADAATLLLNIPPALALGVDTCYVAVGAVGNRRPSDIGSEPLRAVTLPYQVVDAPIGGTQAERTLADLVDYATLAALAAAYPTLFDVAAGP